MIEAVIVDDEKDAIKNLKWEIDRFCTDLTVRDVFTDPVEAVSAINYLKPDCVFLDIEMPEMDGFQLLNQLKYRSFDLIITTAYDNYAIRAFKENAIDYLLKPIDTDDLQRAVNKVKSNKEQNSLGFELKKVLAGISNTVSSKIGIPLTGKTVFKDPSEILYCKSSGNYSSVVFSDKTSELLTKQLKEMESILSNLPFYRVHNSYIVNLNHVVEYIKSDGYYLVLSDGSTVPISRNKRADIQHILKA